MLEHSASITHILQTKWNWQTNDSFGPKHCVGLGSSQCVLGTRPKDKLLQHVPEPWLPSLNAQPKQTSLMKPFPQRFVNTTIILVYRHHPGFCSCGDTYTEPDECSHCPGEACRILDHRHANHWYYTRYECETSNTVWKRNTKVCFLGLPLTPMHTHTFFSNTHWNSQSFRFKSIDQNAKQHGVTLDTTTG